MVSVVALHGSLFPSTIRVKRPSEALAGVHSATKRRLT